MPGQLPLCRHCRQEPDLPADPRHQSGDEVIACVAPAFVGQFGKDATPAKLKTAMRILGFADTVEVAIGADMCTVEEAHDFLDNVPKHLDFMGTSCCPAWSVMAKKLSPSSRTTSPWP